MGHAVCSSPQRSRSACGSAAAAWRSSPAAAWDTCSGSSTPTRSRGAAARSSPGKWSRGRAGAGARLWGHRRAPGSLAVTRCSCWPSSVGASPGRMLCGSADPTVPPKLDCHDGGEPVGLGPGWEVGGECRGLASGLGVMGPLDPGSAARVVPTCACVPAPWPRPTPPEWRYKQVLV